MSPPQQSKPLPGVPQLNKTPSSGSLSRATTATSTSTGSFRGTNAGTATKAAAAPATTATTSRATTGGMRDTKGGEKKKTGIDALLEWCQQTCSGYPEVKITNFTTSWKDGLAFCALMHKYHADSIDFQDMITKTPHERLVTAFEVGALHVRRSERGVVCTPLTALRRVFRRCSTPRTSGTFPCPRNSA